VRILRGQNSLCNFLCNGSKIGQADFVWSAFMATFRYLLILEIGIRFIEKQVFCTDSADLEGLVSLVNSVNLVSCHAKTLLFKKPYPSASQIPTSRQIPARRSATKGNRY
jgi:hypothetical protein